MWILFTCENLRALRVKSSYAFLKRPPGPCCYLNQQSLIVRSRPVKIKETLVMLKLKIFFQENALKNAVCKISARFLRLQSVNPLRAKFFRGKINIYLHFVSFLHIDATQVFEILPQIRQEPTYST